MRVLYINAYDGLNGAGIGGYRSFKIIRDNSTLVNIKMLVKYKTTGDENVIQIPRSFQFYIKEFSKIYSYHSPLSQLHWLCKYSRMYHSTAKYNFLSNKFIDSLKPDLLNLHWLGSDLLTIESIAKLKYPIVWKLADEWIYSGSEHYSYSTDDLKTESNKSFVSRLKFFAPDALLKLSSDTYRRKITYLSEKKFHFVTPSTWLSSKIRASSIFRNATLHVIPNSIDTAKWYPLDKFKSRFRLGIDPDSKVICFGCHDFNDKRKGFDIFLETLNFLKEIVSNKNYSNIIILIFGCKKIPNHINMPFEHVCFQYTSDYEKVREYYSASDLFMVTSRVDNFPNTALEALSCKLPVFGFKTGGLSDIVKTNISGFLATPFDSYELASIISRYLLETNLRRPLEESSRTYVINEFSPPKISKKYELAYQSCLDSYH
ncbi:hypothetical protein SynMEDNS5_00203 [Synechococcus sp. MEDNS5]|uniref:glycosyltransferase n=1 Tax=Synechococcus sp. MEDNS5 TaxID=1442554 RepID=UPI001644FEB9|nr:glycosyltransferase [Synechococcus sp. MEDNS5]QNJ04964.1 hypothetical protein SynMEDNS5_00203 [Synechococcus sp. MEDNS5]